MSTNLRQTTEGNTIPSEKYEEHGTAIADLLNTRSLAVIKILRKRLGKVNAKNDG